MIGIGRPERSNPLSSGEIARMEGSSVAVHGVVHRIRVLSWGAFVVLRRHDGMLQCVIEKDGHEDIIESLSEEQSVRVTGTVSSARIKDVSIRPSSAELKVASLEIIGSPKDKAPVDLTKRLLDLHIDTNLDLRPISLRHPVERARLKIAEGVTRAFRDSLTESGFTEIHSPKICLAGAEGGANIFKVDYFGTEAFLAQSPQFYKQMGVAVFERVFEVGPVFRAEPHQTSRHINEYTSLDFEMGFIEDYTDVMSMEVGILRRILATLEREYSYELEILGAELPSLPEEIPAVTLEEAHSIAGSELGRDLSAEPDLEPSEEKVLCGYSASQWNSDFLFVTHFPTSKRPFYTRDDPDGDGTTLSFDLLFRGLEVTTGGQRIHDYQEQVEKMRSMGLDPESFEGYLMAHRYGLPPHGGLAIGLERLTARILGVENVRLATMFPRDSKRLTP